MNTTERTQQHTIWDEDDPNIEAQLAALREGKEPVSQPVIDEDDPDIEARLAALRAAEKSASEPVSQPSQPLPDNVVDDDDPDIEARLAALRAGEKPQPKPVPVVDSDRVEPVPVGVIDDDDPDVEVRLAALRWGKKPMSQPAPVVESDRVEPAPVVDSDRVVPAPANVVDEDDAHIEARLMALRDKENAAAADGVKPADVDASLSRDVVEALQNYEQPKPSQDVEAKFAAVLNPPAKGDLTPYEGKSPRVRWGKKSTVQLRDLDLLRFMSRFGVVTVNMARELLMNLDDPDVAALYYEGRTGEIATREMLQQKRMSEGKGLVRHNGLSEGVFASRDAAAKRLLRLSRKELVKRHRRQNGSYIAMPTDAGLAKVAANGLIDDRTVQLMANSPTSKKRNFDWRDMDHRLGVAQVGKLLLQNPALLGDVFEAGGECGPFLNWQYVDRAVIDQSIRSSWLSKAWELGQEDRDWGNPEKLAWLRKQVFRLWGEDVVMSDDQRESQFLPADPFMYCLPSPVQYMADGHVRPAAEADGEGMREPDLVVSLPLVDEDDPDGDPFARCYNISFEIEASWGKNPEDYAAVLRKYMFNPTFDEVVFVFRNEPSKRALMKGLASIREGMANPDVTRVGNVPYQFMMNEYVNRRLKIRTMNLKEMNGTDYDGDWFDL